MRGRRPEPLDEGSGVGPGLAGATYYKPEVADLKPSGTPFPGDGRTRCARASVGWHCHPRIEHLLIAVRGRRPEPLDEGSGVGPGVAGATYYKLDISFLNPTLTGAGIIPAKSWAPSGNTFEKQRVTDVQRPQDHSPCRS